MVRGRLIDEAESAVPEDVREWADQVHVHDWGEGPQAVVLRRVSPDPPVRKLLHFTLFALALLSATVAGGFLIGTDPLNTKFTQIGGTWVPTPTAFVWSEMMVGLPFSLAFIGILLGHELGHYFAARRHGISVSPPYFIPFPPYFSLVGTLGAFIRLRGPMVRRSVLFDVGVAGPVVSFLLSIPVLVIGLRMSQVIPTADADLYPFLIRFLGEPMRIGTSALLEIFTHLSLPALESGQTVVLHPVAFAGWLGLFVTALNLLPLGQLDGGHILYAIAGSRQRAFGIAFVVLMIPLGVVWWGWWLWGGIAILVSRGKVAHPPVLMDQMPVTRWRAVLGWTALVVFILTFSPAPLAL